MLFSRDSRVLRHKDKNKFEINKEIFPRFVLSARVEKLGESHTALTLCLKYEK
jgi:hypothetical protein